MARTSRVPPTLNGEGAASCETTPSNLRLATHEQDSEFRPCEQGRGEAEQCHRRACEAARQALQLSGALALQQVALARHYARRSVALMRRAGR